MLKKFIISLFVLLQSISLLGTLHAQENDPRVLIHILDYLSKDYAGAVSDGKIVNAAEYQEQVDFVTNAQRIAQQIEVTQSNPTFLEQLAQLKKSILEKQAAPNVSSLARALQAQVIQNSKIEISPPQWPSIEQGKKLYGQNCASCHGVAGHGDGPAAKALDPSPANFLDESRFADISPFQAFNSIRLGVAGTSMVPFSALSDQEIWNLAFYVISLRYQNLDRGSLPSPLLLSLKEVSSLSDKTIREQQALSEPQAVSVLAATRLQSPSASSNTLGLAKEYLSKARQSQQQGDLSQAKNFALMSYLEGVEPVEVRLRASNSKLVADIEQTMADLRVELERASPTSIIEDKINQAARLIEEADSILQSSSQHSQWFIFFMAFSIILREGFEAVLILVTILGVAKTLGAKKAVQWAHSGWIAALLCGGVAWFFSGWLLGMSGANRETMEGVTSLFAMVVLLYVGFWLHSKSEIGKWTAYIKKQMDSALEGGKLFGIALISFISVFREVFETVLFLRALWLEGASLEKAYLLAGIISAFIAVFIMANLLLKWSVKLPLTKLFAFSSAIMVILAVILTGKGVRALQIAGHISITPIALPIDLSLIGMFPSLETLVSQAMILALIFLLWAYEKKSRIAQV